MHSLRSPWRLAGLRLVGLVGGLAVFAFLAFADTPLARGPEGTRPAHAAAVACLMAIWWLTEALPIYWTACVPLVVFPVLHAFAGGASANLGRTVQAYLDPYIFLFAGGMAIAAAMQQWDLHRRIALGIMQAIGTDPRRLLAGTLVATAFISLWISNTATAAMMMPIGIAIIAQIEAQLGGRRLASYGMAIMLAVAYGANVGGIGTKIGTAPNAQFSGFLERLGTPISFLQFLVVGLPFVFFFLPIVWYGLWRLGRRDGLTGDLGAEVVAAELGRLGRVEKAEKIVLGVFLATAALWIGSKGITSILKPRVSAFELGSAHVEAGIAVLAALVLLAWPHRNGGTVRRILAPRSLLAVPWETLLLLGGGFAMAAAIQGSGLSAFLGARLAGVAGLEPFSQVLMAAGAAVGPLGRGLQHRHHRRAAARAPRGRLARDDDHGAVRRDHRLFLRLCPAGRYSAQRHRLRLGLCHDSTHGPPGRAPRPRRRAPRRRLVLARGSPGALIGPRQCASLPGT